MDIIKDLNNSYIQAKKHASELLKNRGQITSGSSIARIPPHQRNVSAMIAMPPIISSYPHIEKSEWELKLYGLVEEEVTLNWETFSKLSSKDFTVDFHCVTSWSKLDQKFTGVDFKELTKLCIPRSSVSYVIFESYDGYTTNIPYKELLENVCFIAFKMEDKDIEDKYGGPVRAVVPHLYGWKSAKHLKAIRFSQKDEPGFWEVRGYNNHGDPWKEERYS